MSAGGNNLGLRLLALWESARRNCGDDEVILERGVNLLAYDDTLAPRAVVTVLARHKNVTFMVLKKTPTRKKRLDIDPL